MRLGLAPECCPSIPIASCEMGVRCAGFGDLECEFEVYVPAASSCRDAYATLSFSAS